MSILWDVVATEETQGYYSYITKIPHGNPIPDTMVRIARNLSEDEAKAVMNQYPQAIATNRAQPKC